MELIEIDTSELMWLHSHFNVFIMVRGVMRLYSVNKDVTLYDSTGASYVTAHSCGIDVYDPTRTSIAVCLFWLLRPFTSYDMRKLKQIEDLHGSETPLARCMFVSDMSNSPPPRSIT